MDRTQSMDIVVFDLDGTLLSRDSTKIWLTKQLKSHPLRFMGAILISPIAIPLMKFKKYKSIGASLFLWVATYALDKNQLEEKFRDFSIEIKNNSISGLYWFKDGISELELHIKANRKIFIATAAPELLALELLKSIDINAKVIGTPLKMKIGGWIGEIHCRHKEKLRRLQLIGINPPWLSTYTDDIKEDYPILINCINPYLVNGDKQIRLRNELKNIHYLKWS
jgi:phosphatidylglycerophosphatase C